jgi:hypothetical protein
MSEFDRSGLLTPGMKAQRELARRVNAAVLKHVHGLEDLPAVAKQLLAEGVEPDEAARLLIEGFSAGRMHDPLGGYAECCRAIWAAVGRPVRQRTFEEILGR